MILMKLCMSIKAKQSKHSLLFIITGFIVLKPVNNKM